ncbi:MAG: hypothetical protein MJ252_20445 [archaeon]|nr:hypothetical protein [archaeon]
MSQISAGNTPLNQALSPTNNILLPYQNYRCDLTPSIETPGEEEESISPIMNVAKAIRTKTSEKVKIFY